MKILGIDNFCMKRWSNESDGKMYLFTELEEYGINFPIQIYIPNSLSSSPNIVFANRTPREMDNLTFKEALQECIELVPNPVIRLLSYNLGNICVMPVIPRVFGIESSYLGYKIYNNQFDEAFEDKKQEHPRSKFTKEEIYKFTDLHLQIYNMINFIKKYLEEQFNIYVDKKVIMTGFSAAAKFSMFFAALHPDYVKCVIAGGTGGNNIIPDENLTYPLGVKDILNFDLESFRNIPQFYFIGDMDYNDLTTFATNYELLPQNEIKEGESPYVKDISGNNIPRRIDGVKSYHDEIRLENGEKKLIHVQDPIPFDKLDFVYDENGNYQLAYNGGYYTLEQVMYILKNIGTNPQIRFDKMKEIYKNYNINSIFKKYKGDHVTVFDNDELYKDIETFANSINKKQNIIY